MHQQLENGIGLAMAGVLALLVLFPSLFELAFRRVPWLQGRPHWIIVLLCMIVLVTILCLWITVAAPGPVLLY